ncbi:MAG: DUF1127 domain-containing protein [Paracoccaceae bacterium]|nr:DUF1127 domain-containing protein [Paracoccaceae bacterium]
MHTLTQTARPARRFAPFARLLAWLAARDAAYRSACKLAEMPDERLADMGITRAEADAAFLGRFATRDEPPRFGW